MHVIIKHITLIERIDQLIRLQAAGPPEVLASRLAISKATLTRMICTMKELGAPITYDFNIQSYSYCEPVKFKFGFYV